MRPSAIVWTTIALLALASCTNPEDRFVFVPQNTQHETTASSYADAIAAGMERARLDRVRRWAAGV